MDNIGYLWSLVNNAETHKEVRRAEETVNKSAVDNNSYDELMMALAYKSREAYHRDSGY